MGFKKWRVAKYDKELAKTLSEECEVDPIVALIATSRGYSDASELEQFLSDEPCFSDPREMADIIKAADYISEEISKGTLIAVYGDYDCDGVTSTALLYSYLKSRNANCTYYIPDRFSEGYGMNNGAIDYLKSIGVGMIVTVDNGISCIDEINHANSLGMKVIVTDHHIPLKELPQALAVVDPHRTDCPSTFKSICGAEVAFKLICVIENKEPEELLPYFADLLSVAIVADVMPLTFENRCILKVGIEKLKTSPMTGLAAIMSVAGIAKESINSGRIAFGISPRINAAGRMGKADCAVDLMLSSNMIEALRIANEIDAKNTERQRTERKIIAEAIEKIEVNGYCHDRIIVVEGEGWHHGIVGIVASKITEKYGSPCVVISVDGNEATGSGRSFEGFSLYNAILSCRDLLSKFGGHELAAGISIDTDKIDEFRQRINSYAASFEYVPPVLNLDCKLNPTALSLDIAEAVKLLEPFGNSNQTPIFGIYGVTLQRITPIGSGKHLRLIFTKDLTSFQALLFGVTPENFCFEQGDLLDVAVTVDTNFYNNNYSLTVQIKAIRMNGTDDDRLFGQIDNYNRYVSGMNFNVKQLFPSREEIGIVYKFITAKTVSSDRIIYYYINSVGYDKTMIALTILTELGLIENVSGKLYKAVMNAKKTDLMNSETYRKLTEMGEKNECRTNQ